MFSYAMRAVRMKLIKCIIQPRKLDEVVNKLEAVVPGMTVAEVRGYGHQRGHPVVYRGVEYEVNLLPKAAIDSIVDDNRLTMS